jgi:hypothetical protein
MRGGERARAPVALREMKLGAASALRPFQSSVLMVAVSPMAPLPKKKRSILDEYWKHTALNLGQATRDIRFFYYHPAADSLVKGGTLTHGLYSMLKRAESLGNNLYYAIIPPHGHHTSSDLRSMSSAPARLWFLHGYAPWRFPDPRPGKKRNGAFTI